MSTEEKEVVVENPVVEAQVENPAVDVEEAEKIAGTKEFAVDSDSMAVEADKVEAATKESEKVEDVLPSFFVDVEKRHRVEVDILSSTSDGSIKSVSKSDMGLNFEEDFSYLKHTRVWFDFTLPTYEDMANYRKRSSVYRREAGQMMVDKLQLRNFMLVWHLKDWSMTDKDGKIELAHDKDGSLQTESIEKVYALHPTLIDVVMTIFEKNLLLT